MIVREIWRFFLIHQRVCKVLCISIVKEYSVITQRTKIGLFEFLKNHIFVHDTGFHNPCIYVENVSKNSNWVR